ncbi:MAG: hypothetical protein JW797_02385 [Bradymonadales bacterium]|nr:hypothetical protein [Bradymonadales bacterium]
MNTRIWKGNRGFLAGAATFLLLAGCLPTDDGDSGPGPSVDMGGWPDAGPDASPDALSDTSGQDGAPPVDLGLDDSPEEPEDEQWLQWGTRGSTSSTPRSSGGYAYCGLEDIRTDDLTGRYDAIIPEGEWASTPVADEASRCGDDEETTIWRLLNCERITRELDPLACDLRLVWLGREHSKDMVVRSFFGHINPDGEDPFDRMALHGITYSSAGENIAQNSEVEDTHWRWMDSTSGHRDNILFSSFDHNGTGIIRSGVYYWFSQEFIGL